VVPDAPLFVDVPEVVSSDGLVLLVPERLVDPVPEPVTEPEPVAEPVALVVPVRDEPGDEPVELVSDEQPQNPRPKLQEIITALKKYFFFPTSPPFLFLSGRCARLLLSNQNARKKDNKVHAGTA
jgi:hypothetical protein